MEKTSEIFEKGKQQAMKIDETENTIQGLYFDLLSCIGGGDHPSLPQGHNLKPMTGFLDIVEAFNDVAKLHAAGSGIVCEVGSKEFEQDGSLTSGSRVSLQALNCNHKAETDSLLSFHCSDNFQRQSSADSYQSANTNDCGSEGLNVNGSNTDTNLNQQASNERLSFDIKKTEIHATENEQSALDENGNFKVNICEVVGNEQEFILGNEIDAASEKNFNTNGEKTDALNHLTDIDKEMKTLNDQIDSIIYNMGENETDELSNLNDKMDDQVMSHISNENESLSDNASPNNNENENGEVCILGNKIHASIPNAAESEEDVFQVASAVFYSNSNYIEEVGPPLSLSDVSMLNPVHQDIKAMESEMQKYSEELKEIERMLKEHLNLPIGNSHQSTMFTATRTNDNTNELQTEPNFNGNSVVQTLADGLVSPSSALEMMYDMESNASLSNNTPSVHSSRYQSCTSFNGWENQRSLNNSSIFNTNLSPTTIRRTPSMYMECIDINENGSSNFSQYANTFEFVNPSFVSKEAAATSASANTQEQVSQAVNSPSWEDGQDLLSDMVNKFTSAIDINASDLSYYSVNEESDVQEFADATEDSTDYKRKKKLRFSDKSAVESDDEHLWTSASGSVSEEENDD